MGCLQPVLHVDVRIAMIALTVYIAWKADTCR